VSLHFAVKSQIFNNTRMATIMGGDIRRLSLSVLKGNDLANQVNMEYVSFILPIASADNCAPDV